MVVVSSLLRVAASCFAYSTNLPSLPRIYLRGSWCFRIYVRVLTDRVGDLPQPPSSKSSKLPIFTWRWLYSRTTQLSSGLAVLPTSPIQLPLAYCPITATSPLASTVAELRPNTTYVFTWELNSHGHPLLSLTSYHKQPHPPLYLYLLQ